MDLYQIVVGSIVTLAWFTAVIYSLRELIKTWQLVQFSCEKQCCTPRAFAICSHGGAPTDTPCPHHTYT